MAENAIPIPSCAYVIVCIVLATVAVLKVHVCAGSAAFLVARAFLSACEIFLVVLLPIRSVYNPALWFRPFSPFAFLALPQLPSLWRSTFPDT